MKLSGLREFVTRKVTLKNILLNLNHGFLKEVIRKKITDTDIKKFLDDKNKKVNNKTEKSISFTVTYI